MFEITTREVAAEKVATITAHVRQEELSRFIPDAIGRIRAHVAAQGAVAKDVDLTLYHSSMGAEGQGTVEVCVPFTGSVEPAGDVGVRTEPAHTEAFARVTKGQVVDGQVMGAFDAVGSWLGENGLEVCGPAREVYFADWDAVDAATPAVDAALPFVR